MDKAALLKMFESVSSELCDVNKLVYSETDEGDKAFDLEHQNRVAAFERVLSEE